MTIIAPRPDFCQAGPAAPAAPERPVTRRRREPANAKQATAYLTLYSAVSRALAALVGSGWPARAGALGPNRARRSASWRP